MARYLMTWEIAPTSVPVDPKERAAVWLPVMQMVKQDMQSGLLKEWGVYIGETKGFAVAEGSEEEVDKMAHKYIPHVQFTTHPVLTIDQREKTLKERAK
jgi:hypothetical protein